MADITVTAAQVAVLQPETAEIYDFIATEAITAGQAVYMLTTGKVGVADANAAGKQLFRGIALKSVGAGQAVSVIKQGMIAGFTLTSQNRDVPLYLSDTAGALADAAATKLVRAGRVVALSDNSLSKALYVEATWNTPEIFVSAEQTGTGSAQNVAHGLGFTPTQVFIALTAGPGAYTQPAITEGSHTATNVVVTVTSNWKFRVIAIL
jgi:hypothetical protein